MRNEDAASGTPDRPLRVRLLQTEVVDGDPETNVQEVLGQIVGGPPADLLILPELWTSGYCHDRWGQIAAEETPRIAEMLGGAARACDFWIAGSMIGRDADGGLRNRLSFFGPDGEVVSYDKGHLFEPMGEVGRLVPGESRTEFTLRGWRVAASICFDLRFPEMYRISALNGAVLFVVVAAWPHVRREAFQILCRARALENQVFLVACNRAGYSSDGTRFAGGSMVVRPDGAVVGSLGPDAGQLEASLDPGTLRELRNPPTLALRRAEIDSEVDP